MGPSPGLQSSIPRHHYGTPRETEKPFSGLSKADAYQLMGLPPSIRYFAMDLANRGVAPADAAFYMESVREPKAVYQGMVDSFEGEPRMNIDALAKVFYRRLPQEAIAANILLDDRVEDVDLDLMDVARRKAFRKFGKDSYKHLSNARELLKYLHLPEVVDEFRELNQSEEAQTRRLVGDEAQFSVDVLAEEAGPRFASAVTLHLEYKMPAQRVLDVLSLKRDRDYKDFFIIADVLHNAGLGNLIPDYADLFLQAAKEGKNAERFINTVN